MTEEELEERLNKLKMLNRNIIVALEKAKKDYKYLQEYDKAVQEYENEKKRLYEELYR